MDRDGPTLRNLQVYCGRSARGDTVHKMKATIAHDKVASWKPADDDVLCIRVAAPMHKVSKIGIPDAILQKPHTFRHKFSPELGAETTPAVKAVVVSSIHQVS